MATTVDPDALKFLEGQKQPSQPPQPPSQRPDQVLQSTPQGPVPVGTAVPGQQPWQPTPDVAQTAPTDAQMQQFLSRPVPPTSVIDPLNTPWASPPPPPQQPQPAPQPMPPPPQQQPAPQQPRQTTLTPRGTNVDPDALTQLNDPNQTYVPSTSPAPTFADVARGTARGPIETVANTLASPIYISDFLSNRFNLGMYGLTGADMFKPPPPWDPKIGDKTGEPEWLYNARTQGLSAPIAQRIQGGLDALIPPPTSDLGKGAEYVSSFFPGALAGPASSLAAKAGNLVTQGVVPGVASLAAGNLAESAVPGTGDVVRTLTGMGWPTVYHGLTAPSGPQKLLASNLRNVTDAELAQAQAHQQQVYNNTGLFTTPDQAINTVTGGKAAALSATARVLEKHPDSAPIMQGAYADNPQRMDAAVNATLDHFGNPAQPGDLSRTPGGVVDQGQKAAAGALDDIRQGINRTVDPYYAATRAEIYPPTALQSISQEPAFIRAFNNVRGDPITYRDALGQPVNTGNTLVAIRQELSAMMDRATSPGAGKPPGTMTAGAIKPIRDRLDAIISAQSPDWQTALTRGSEQRADLLNPQESGPLGQIRDAPDAATMGKALYGSTSPDVHLATEDAIQKLNKAGADLGNPNIAGDITRQYFADRWNAAQNAARGAEGAQNAGARFVHDVAGNTQTATNINTNLQQLPPRNLPDIVPGTPGTPPAPVPGPPGTPPTMGPGTPPTPAVPGPPANPVGAWNDLAEALRTTGNRLPSNSATASNQQVLGKVSEGRPLLDVMKTLPNVLEWPRVASDLLEHHRTTSNAQTLGRLLTERGPGNDWGSFYNAVNAARARIQPQDIGHMLSQRLRQRMVLGALPNLPVPPVVQQESQ